MNAYEVATKAIDAERQKHKNRSSPRLAGAALDALHNAGYAIVQLPEPDSTRYEGEEHEAMDRLSWQGRGGFEVSNWLENEVQLSVFSTNGAYGSWDAFEPITAHAARDLAAALLAAAVAADARS